VDGAPCCNTQHATPPLLSPDPFLITSTHKPRTRGYSWAPDGLQSDTDTDRVMVEIDNTYFDNKPKLKRFLDHDELFLTL
jgi:hypothetical protein